MDHWRATREDREHKERDRPSHSGSQWRQTCCRKKEIERAEDLIGARIPEV